MRRVETSSRRRGILVALVVAVGLGGAAAGSRGTVRETPWDLRVANVVTPASAVSGQPQLTTSGRGVILSWIEREGTRARLRFAQRTSTGWSPSADVAAGEDWFVNWADVPSVVRLADGTLAAHWLQKSGPATYSYDVRLSFSRDEGRTWSPSFTPHRDGTKTEHGFASLFQTPGAGLGLVWLDGRDTKPETSHDAHGAAGGAMTLRAAVFDAAGKQLSETLVDSRVCDCCPTAVAVTVEGPIAAFRDRSDAEVRDISIARLQEGQWTAPTPVHRDGWTIAACPVNGPALAASGRRVAAAWFTARDDEGRAYVAFSDDAGRTFGAPVRVDDASALGRVDVEWLPDGAAAVSWVEYAGDRAQFRVRRVDAAGNRSAAVTVAGLVSGRASGYPRMAAYAGELVFAWTESATGTSPSAPSLQVKTAFAKVP